MTTRPYVEGLSPLACRAISTWPGRLRLKVAQTCDSPVLLLEVGHAAIASCCETLEGAVRELDLRYSALRSGAMFAESVLKAIEEANQ